MTKLMAFLGLIAFAMAAALFAQPAAAQEAVRVMCPSGIIKPAQQMPDESDDAVKLRVCHGKKLVATPKDSACGGKELKVNVGLTDAALDAYVAEVCPAKAEPAEKPAEPKVVDTPKLADQPKVGCNRECLEEIVKAECGKHHGIDTKNWRGTRAEMLELVRTVCHKHAYRPPPQRRAYVPPPPKAVPPPVPPSSLAMACDNRFQPGHPAGYGQVVPCLWTHPSNRFQWGSACESRSECRRRVYREGQLVPGPRTVAMTVYGVPRTPTTIVVNGERVPFAGGTINVPLMNGVAKVSFDIAWFCGAGNAAYVAFHDPRGQGLSYPNVDAGFFTKKRGDWQAGHSELCSGFNGPDSAKWRSHPSTRLNLLDRRPSY